MISNVLKLLYRRWIRIRFSLRRVHTTALIVSPKSIAPDLIAGKDCFINAGSQIGPGVELGDYVLIGPDVLFTGDDHQTQSVGVPTIFSGRPILRTTRVGNDVWIGAKSVVLSGVSVGTGSIVAAGAVVTKDVPPCSVVGGVPAKFLRWRFEREEDREQHLQRLAAGDFKRTFAKAKSSL